MQLLRAERVLFGMSDRQLLARMPPPGGTEGHVYFEYPIKDSGTVNICLRKVFADDVDEDVPKEFYELLRSLN